MTTCSYIRVQDRLDDSKQAFGFYYTLLRVRASSTMTDLPQIPSPK
jgi:hypothetical protein